MKIKSFNIKSLSMAYTDPIDTLTPGKVNRSYLGGKVTESGTYIPKEFCKFQNLPNNKLKNVVWHIDSGSEAIEPAKKGYLKIDLTSAESGAEFKVHMNIKTAKITKVSIKFEDFEFLYPEPLSIELVIDLLNSPLEDLLKRITEKCKLSQLVKRQLLSFISSYSSFLSRHSIISPWHAIS